MSSSVRDLPRSHRLVLPRLPERVPLRRREFARRDNPDSLDSARLRRHPVVSDPFPAHRRAPAAHSRPGVPSSPCGRSISTSVIAAKSIT